MSIPENRTLFVCDNLPVLRGIDSKCIDLIATDPPFNTKRQFNAPLGSRAAGQKFDDRWKWDEVADEWHDLIATDYPAIKELIEAAVVIEGGGVSPRGEIDPGRVKNSIAAFLVWMAPRLIGMHRILKPTGSMYLHCDPTASHFLKLLMDAVFGRRQFRNEVVWCYEGRELRKTYYNSKHDNILFYTRSKNFVFNYEDIGTPLKESSKKALSRFVDDDGKAYILRYKAGGGFAPKTKEGSDEVYRQYVPACVPPRDWVKIDYARKSERTGWRTQKPLALYRRIIKASSNEGDVVLDPFAGCATTCVAAELLERQWIGIDIDPVAETVTANRLNDEVGVWQEDDKEYFSVKKRPPIRTDIPPESPEHMRLVLWKRQGRRCANPYCSTDEIRKAEIHLDHVIPKSRGGSDDISNRNALCGNCNLRKGSKAWGLFLDEERSKQPHPKIGR